MIGQTIDTARYGAGKMTNDELKTKLTGMAILLGTSLLWGVAFVAQSAGMAYIGPFTFTTMRSVLAAIGLAIMILVFDRIGPGPKKIDRRRLWKAGLLLGIIVFVANNLQQVALQYTSVGKGGFITSLYIVFVPIIGIFIKRKPHPMLWPSVLLAAIGLYFLSVRGDFTMEKGDLLMFACAIVFAIHILAIDRFAGSMDVIRLNCIQFAVTAVLSAIPMALWEKPTITAVSLAWLPLAYAGIVSGCIAYSMQMFAQKRVEPTTASLLLSPESVFSALAGWVILGEVMTARELFGCSLVFIAVVGSQLPWNKLLRPARQAKGESVSIAGE
jgi:drug/metabolite transporter (DMT)-like permease